MKTLPYTHPVTVAAHRGNSGHFAENTMPSFRSAVAVGADMIETDIHLTKDNVLVLMHDDALDRTTDGTGKIKDYTYEELKAFNCDPTGKNGDGEKAVIPTLEEFLSLCSANNIMVNLEIKEYFYEGNEERCRFCVRETLAMVEKYHFADRTIINSFDAYVLAYTEELAPGRYLLHGFYPYSIMRNVDRNPDEYLYCACIFDDRNELLYHDLESRGIEPWAGAGVKEPEHFAVCTANGARLFTTNFPAETIEILKAQGKR